MIRFLVAMVLSTVRKMLINACHEDSHICTGTGVGSNFRFVADLRLQPA